MKRKPRLFHARLICAVALGIGSPFSVAAAAEHSGDTAEASRPSAQLGVKAGADYQGLAVMPTAGAGPNTPSELTGKLDCYWDKTLWIAKGRQDNYTGLLNLPPGPTKVFIFIDEHEQSID